MHEEPDWQGQVTTKPAEESLKRLAGALPEGVALLREGRVVWASERLAVLAGWGSCSALEGAVLDELFVDAGQGLPDGRLRSVECTLRRANGQELTVVCRPAWPDVTPGTDAWVVEDAARVRELERELLHMSRELGRANREVAVLRERLQRDTADRGELLGVVSHELRTPLMVVGGYARLLLSEKIGPLNDDQRGYLDEADRSVRKLDAFVARLLEGSRELGVAAVLELSTEPLSPVIEGVIQALHPLLERRSVRLALRLGSSRARFDAARVEQVMTNLLGNAIRYARPGGSVEVSTCEVERGGRALVEVAVADDGPGVPPADRERIFEPYVRGDGAEPAAGLGLGLAICRRLVEAHGGSIEVGERPGGGARFAFTLAAAER